MSVRRQQLNELINQAYNLISKLEHNIMVSTEPLDKARWQKQITEKRSEIKEWEQELEQFDAANVVGTIDDERSAVLTYLDALQKSFEKYEIHQRLELLHKPGRLGQNSMPAPLTKDEEELAE